MNDEWEPCKSEPDPNSEVNYESLEEELVGTTVQEVEEPLLGGIGSVVPDVTTHITFLLVEVVFTIPGLVHHLWNTKTLSINESHVFGVAQLVVC